MRKLTIVFPFLIYIIIWGCSNDKSQVTSKAQEVFVINNDKFSANSQCDADCIFEITSENNNVAVSVKTGCKPYFRVSASDMLKGVAPSATWCNGVRHVWKGTVRFEDYTFDSEQNEPLQFVVDLTSGYRYEKGKGTITTPDNKLIKLPL